MCGADNHKIPILHAEEGSPPRVRSRLAAVGWLSCFGGITSACAEQTTDQIRVNGLGEDHLRVCGADLLENSNVFASLGSPPRVRSRRQPSGGRASPVGITSACAEQTLRTVATVDAGTDHLRVCGADVFGHPDYTFHPGSPPRVRSRHDAV